MQPQRGSERQLTFANSLWRCFLQRLHGGPQGEQLAQRSCREIQRGKNQPVDRAKYFVQDYGHFACDAHEVGFCREGGNRDS